MSNLSTSHVGSMIVFMRKLIWMFEIKHKLNKSAGKFVQIQQHATINAKIKAPIIWTVFTYK